MYQILKDNFRLNINLNDEIKAIKDLIHSITINLNIELINFWHNDAINNLIKNIGRDNVDKIFVLMRVKSI